MGDLALRRALGLDVIGGVKGWSLPLLEICNA